MTKRIAAMLLLAASLSLWGCRTQLPEQPITAEPATVPATEPATAPTTVPTTPTTAPATEPAAEPTTVPTASATEPAKKNLQQVKAVGAYIFDGPSYDGGVVQPMPTGTYTIAEEKLDGEGNLWGKLKSGLGWICLTDIRNFDAPVAIGELDPEMKKQGGYRELTVHGSAYAIPVVIQACEALDILDVYSCLMVTDRMAPQDLLASSDGMKKGEKIVVWLEFPGDLSTYEIQALCSSGETCRYQIATSGRNATLSVWPVA